MTHARIQTKPSSYSKETHAVDKHKSHLTRDVNVSPKNSIFQVHIFDKNLKKINLIANLAVIFNGDLCFGSF